MKRSKDKFYMKQIFDCISEVDMAALGFPSGWENEPLWQ